MRDEQDLYRAKGVTTLGMNPASVEAHDRYVAKFQFPFPLVSDPERVAAKAYSALKGDGKGIMRTVYLIGKDGTVLFGQQGMPAGETIIKPLG